MKFRKYYFVIIVLVVAVVVASTLLMPGKQEMARMQMKDKHFEEAQKAYESQLHAGKASIETANELSELYLQAGAVDKATQIMEKFVADNPGHIDALKKLGRLYQYGQRQDDYLRTLESINKLQSDPETLQQLSQIYNSSNEHEKQADTLKKLVEVEKGEEASHVMDLANILASNHAYGDAVDALKTLRQNHAEQFAIREELLMVSLLLDDKQPDAALQEASNWVDAKHDVDDGAQLLDVLVYKGNPALGEKLLAHFTDEQINANADLLEHYVQLQSAAGNDEAVYQRLVLLHVNHTLPEKLASQLVFMAAMHHDKAMVQEILASNDASKLSESQWLALLEMAQDEHDAALLGVITQIAGKPELRDAHPVLSAMLVVSNASGNADEALQALYALKLNNSQALQVARICAHANNNACRDHFLNSIETSSGLSDAEIADIGMIYWQSKEWDKGHAFLIEAMKTHNTPQIDSVMLRFAAARGDDKAILQWLAAQADADSHMLADLYFTAMNTQHYATAILVAQFLQKKNDSPASRSMLVSAYIKTGQFDLAIKLLRQNEKMSEEDRQNYLLCLSKLAPYHPEYRKELNDISLRQLHSNIPEAQKISLVYALLNSHQDAVAMPYVRELAIHKGGHWADFYATELDKQGKHEEARLFWIKIAYAPTTSPDEKNTIAYTLLHNGYKADAEALFAQRAEHASADSDEVNALLYLWGPQPSVAQLQWLQARYRTAPDTEKSAWGKLLSEHMTDDAVIAAIDANPLWLHDDSLTARYLQALVDNGSFKDKAKDVLATIIALNDVQPLHAYGRVAKQNGFTREARKAYEQAIIMDPKDNAALREVGMIAYAQSDYSTAELDLGQYIEAYDGGNAKANNYEPFFDYAQLLRRHKQLDEARKFYVIAIDLIDMDHLHTPEALAAKAESQIWIGDNDAGLKTFEEARAAYPDNDILRADLISTMLELRGYDEARDLLATPPHSSFDDIPLVAHVSLADKNITQTSLIDNDKKLLVQFAHPITDRNSLSPQNLSIIPWIAYASQGYDSLLIVAKPGYKFAIDNVQSPMLMAVVDPSSPVIEQNRQTALRYALLTARTDLETGHIYNATKRLDELLPQYANDAQMLGFAANAENYGDNWPLAQEWLDKAHSIAPENEDITRLQHDARLLHAQNISLGQDFTQLGKAHENITTISGFTNVGSQLQVGATVQNNAMRVSNIRRANGQVEKFDADRQRGEFYVQRYMEEGQLLKFSLFANNDTAGAGANYSFLNTLGRTTLTGEWHKPYWELPEAVADDTTRDRIAIEHVIKPTTHMIISGGVGINRYNDMVSDNVLSTTSGNFSAVYSLLDEQPFLAVGYGIDAEYRRSQKRAFDSVGEYSKLLPQNTREVHFFSVNSGYNFNDITRGDMLLGYGIDRFGGNGPTVSGKLTYELTDQIDVQLHAFYGMDSSDSKNNTSQIGADIRWRFDHDRQ